MSCRHGMVQHTLLFYTDAHCHRLLFWCVIWRNIFDPCFLFSSIFHLYSLKSTVYKHDLLKSNAICYLLILLIIAYQHMHSVHQETYSLRCTLEVVTIICVCVCVFSCGKLSHTKTVRKAYRSDHVDDPNHSS